MSSWSHWAYDPGTAVPAHLVTRSAEELESQIHLVFGGRRNPNSWRKVDLDTLNSFGVRPVVVTGTKPDEWHVEEGHEAAVHSYVTSEQPKTYQIQRSFREMTIEESKAKAQRDLEAYWQAYARSQFIWRTSTFRADATAESAYQRDWNRTREDEINQAPSPWHPTSILDINGVAVPIASLADWKDFYATFDALEATGRANAKAAWGDIAGYTTTDEVRQRMQLLYSTHPIPGTTPAAKTR